MTAGAQQQTRADFNQIALDAATAIEGEFARKHAGGATQRLAKVQVIILDAIISAFGALAQIDEPEARE